MADTEKPTGQPPASDDAVSPAALPDAAAEEGDRPETEEASGTSENDAAAEADGGDRPPANPRVRDIISLRRRAQEAEARAAAFERLLLQREQQKPAAEPPPAPQFDPSPFLPPPPDPSKFQGGEFDPAYIRETVKRDLQADMLRAEMARRHAAQQAEAQRAQQRDAMITQRASERFAEAKEAMPELEADLQVLMRLPQAAGDVLTIVMAESEYGPEIFRHLANNEQDRERLAGMSHATAAIFVGRLEERIARAKAEASATKAPPPPKTLPGKGKPATDLYDPDMPMDEFARRFQRRYYQRN